MIKINSKDFLCKSENGDELISFTLFLDQVLPDNKSNLKLKLQLRKLKRSKTNLLKVQSIIRELTTYYNKETDSIVEHFTVIPEALFSYAAILYRAQFVRGEGGRKPLEFLLEELSDNHLHIHLREIADKKIAHLDKNHEARSESLSWDYVKVGEDVFSPIRSNMSGRNFNSYDYNTLVRWKELISEIIYSVDIEIQLLEDELNSLLPDISLGSQS